MIEATGKAFGRCDFDRILDDFDDDSRKPGDVDKFADGGMRKVRAAHDFGDRNQRFVKTDLRVHDGVISPAGNGSANKKIKKFAGGLIFAVERNAEGRVHKRLAHHKCLSGVGNLPMSKYGMVLPQHDWRGTLSGCRPL